MQSKTPSKLSSLQKISNSHGDSSNRNGRKTKGEASELLAAEDAQKNEISHDGVERKTSASDLLRVCRPLSVYLTRLPDSLINKNVEATKKLPVKKTKSFHRWRFGASGRRRRKIQKQQKHLQSLQSQAAQNKSNPDALVISDGTFASLNNTETLTTLPSDVKESTVEENESEGNEAHLKVAFMSLAHEITLSEIQECNISNTVRINAAAVSSEQLLISEESQLPKEQELQIDESCEGMQPDDRTLLAKGNYNENSTVSQLQEGNTSGSNLRHGRKRKSSWLSESIGSSLEERHATVSDEIGVTSPQRPFLFTNRRKRRRTAIKEGVRPKKVQSMNEVVVVVNRLDNSRSPLVEKWKNRLDLSRLDEVVPNLRETLSVATSSINQVEKENENDFEATITDNESEGITTYSAPLMNLPSFNENNDIVMCDSNEEGSEEDDDEIIEFLAARRKTKFRIRSTDSEDKTDDELAESQRSRRSNIEASPVNRSDSRSNVKQITGRSRQRKQSFGTIEDATPETSYYARSARIESKSPSLRKSGTAQQKQTRGRSRQRKRSFNTIDDATSESSYSVRSIRIQSKSPSLPKTRRARRMSHTNSDDFTYRASKSPPVTRSRSRAAIDQMYRDESIDSNDVFYVKSPEKICHRVSADTSDNSNKAGEPNEEINENERQVTVDYTKNDQEVVESEDIGNDEDSLDSSAANDSNLPLIDTLPIERNNDIENCRARKKLATMKDAMVVLTRLEDLNNQYSDSEAGFGATCALDFSSNFFSETHQDYIDSLDNIDATRSSSCCSVDPLQIDSTPLNETPAPGNFLDNDDTQCASEIENRRENGISRGSEQTNQDETQPRVSEQWVQLGSDTTLTRNDRARREMAESDDERQLTVDESIPTETMESDVELTLIVDECDNSTPEPTTRNLIEGVLMDANGNNDKVNRISPCKASPSKDLAAPGQRCNCTEHQGDNRHHKCQNISPNHKCITCNRLFKDADQLTQHKASNAYCYSGFLCNFCKKNFETLIELSKHRSSCAEKKLQRRNSVDPKTREETVPESQISASTNSETSLPKGKKQKQVIQKNAPKKNRSRPRCRSDNLTCNVCSTNFDTKTDLSEHLYKHSPEELQEAFRAAKAKAMADSQAEQAAKRKETNSNASADELAADPMSSDTIISSVNENGSILNLNASDTQIIVSNVSTIPSTTFENHSLTSRPATVCLCHRDTDLTSLNKGDLQIEMVLLCIYCRVIFRRRECLEVHYRTSSNCSVNRTRERCPSLFCANCQLTLNSWADMRQHLETHANQNSERTIRFVCNICRVVFVGFGALFYNHWTSHSKDPMFVAGRYNFPKFSVQAITGTEKLPAGARFDENYIFVAEHVCATCKKPFSTRRDLEVHQQSVSCIKQTPIPNKDNVSTRQIERPNERIVNPSVRRTETHPPKTKKASTKTQNNADTRLNKRPPLTPTTASAGAKEDHLVNKRMYCDVCTLAFINEHWLNMHSRNMHKNHFTFVSTALAGLSPSVPFKCTECSVFTASVSAIEEHWKTDPRHKDPAAYLKTTKSSNLLKPAASASPTVTSSLDPGKDLQNPLLNASIINVNDVSSTDKSKVSKEPPIITIDDADSNSDSRASEDTLIPPDEESVISVPITSTESIQVSNINVGPVLCDPSENPPLVTSNSDDKPRSKIRALEDPCVNVMLSEASGTNVSASLVMGDTEDKTNDNTANSDTESYRILLSRESSAGNLKMILSRTSSTDSAETLSGPTPPAESSVAENIQVAQTEGSDSTVSVETDEGTTVVRLTGSSDIEKDKVAQTAASDSAAPVDPDEEPTLVNLTQSVVAEEDKVGQTAASDSTAPVDSDEESTLVIVSQSDVAEEDKVGRTAASDSTPSVDSDEEPALVIVTESAVSEKDTEEQTAASDSTPPVDLDEGSTVVVVTESAVTEEHRVEQTAASDSTPPVDLDEAPTQALLTQSSIAEVDKVAQKECSDSTVHHEPSLIRTPPKSAPARMAANGPVKAINSSVVPEVIDILDDPEDCESEQSTEPVNPTVIMMAQSCTDSLIHTNKILNSAPESEKSDVNQSRTDASAITIDRPKSLAADNAPKTLENCSGSDTSSNPPVGKSASPGRSKINKAAFKLASMSFEEARWNWLRSSSANPDIPNSTAPKKQGFLRVKDLSELQAVRNFTCVICHSSFESEKSLNEHRESEMCGSSVKGRNIQYPRGMSAALVLPDPSERPKTPENDLAPLAPLINNLASSLKRALTSQSLSYPPREIASAASGQRIQTMNQLSLIPVNNKSLGSWIAIGNTPGPNIISNQVQENQPLQQHQLALFSGGSVRTQDPNQGLPENSRYNPLRSMVGGPGAQTNIHQPMVAPQRLASSNPLPKCTGRTAPVVIQQSAKQNKYLCSICHSFECTSLEAINEHVRKHVHGWKNSTVTQDSRQPSPIARLPAPSSETISLSSLEIRGDGTQQVSSKNARTEMGTASNRVTANTWTIKDTPQGPVLVTPVSTESTNRSVLGQASFNSNNLAANAPYSGQLVFRCRICNSAVYKNYPPLRNHAILVHGITDFNSLLQENISQNSYLCTQCPNTALFDTGEEFREHVDSIHTHSCPSCRRVFSNFLTLRHHLEQCRVSTSSNRNTYANNC